MMTIRRSCSYRIITRAVNAEGQPLVGLLAPGAEDCELCLDADQLQAAVKARADTVIVYNQHADALALVDTLNVPESQVPLCECNRSYHTAQYGLHDSPGSVGSWPPLCNLP